MKQHKFNWVDGVVIAVILLLIAGTVLKFVVLDPNARQKQTVDFTYQVEINGVRQYTVDALQVGDTLFDDAGKAAVGVIESIETEQAQTVGYMPDGTAVLAPVEDRLDVTLTLRAQGVPEKDFYKVGTYEIKVNQTSLYFTKYSIWSGRVVSIEAGS